MAKQQVQPAAQAEISVFAFHIKGDPNVVTNALQTLAKQGVSFQPALTPKPPTVALPAPADTAQQASSAVEESPVHVEEAEPVAKPRKRHGFAVPKMVDELPRERRSHVVQGLRRYAQHH